MAHKYLCEITRSLTYQMAAVINTINSHYSLSTLMIEAIRLFYIALVQFQLGSTFSHKIVLYQE